MAIYHLFSQVPSKMSRRSTRRNGCPSNCQVMRMFSGTREERKDRFNDGRRLYSMESSSLSSAQRDVRGAYALTFIRPMTNDSVINGQSRYSSNCHVINYTRVNSARRDHSTGFNSTFTISIFNRFLSSVIRSTVGASRFRRATYRRNSSSRLARPNSPYTRKTRPIRRTSTPHRRTSRSHYNSTRCRCRYRVRAYCNNSRRGRMKRSFSPFRQLSIINNRRIRPSRGVMTRGRRDNQGNCRRICPRLIARNTSLNANNNSNNVQSR